MKFAGTGLWCSGSRLSLGRFEGGASVSGSEGWSGLHSMAIDQMSSDWSLGEEEVCEEGVCEDEVCEGVCEDEVCEEGVCEDEVCEEGVCEEGVCEEGVCEEGVCEKDEGWSRREGVEGEEVVTMGQVLVRGRVGGMEEVELPSLGVSYPSCSHAILISSLSLLLSLQEEGTDEADTPPSVLPLSAVPSIAFLRW